MSKETGRVDETKNLKRSLIVSYSYSGNTHRIAREIKAATSGDWCEVHPWQPYPMAFPELLEQVKREIRSGYYPRLLPGPFTPRFYPVIFVGSPNWCGTIAPPLASWLHGNDLAGKILLPFYSHCGGAAGDFRKEIARLCPKADVREPLGVIDGGGEDLQEILRQWFIRTGMMEDMIAHAG
ncbi:MAG TPA: flavodoxin [Candidatus Eisenbergiella merdipullorum]|uniref:Flavodoxin n=1 Tax=Candidatus Eisenbergiella merdipullorum TaxID=2838553 RepID=A0A9D2L0L5_9FIRM|nr:flavodoxin [Candidatus Eisenbergiella merdipullorum]